MPNDRLMLAAILAFIHAVMTRPLSALTSSLMTRPDMGAKLITVLLAMVGFAIFAFLFTTFKRLLNERYEYHGADLSILALIGLNAAGAALTLLPVVGIGPNTLSLAFNAASILFGLLLVGLAVQLLRLPSGLIALLRPYAFIIAVSGVGIASIKLANIGMIFGIVADILLGIIFIKESGTPLDNRI
ncbi:hypothetical protein [Methylohalobius crimeensis]|uniref:hypothetical protein n=1 Tax=Methylohalobius crimeensis TaxID=244365 RepID=UPI0003B63266|nr:hypothetical protein [Methylohalobius crimeensis]